MSAVPGAEAARAFLAAPVEHVRAGDATLAVRRFGSGEPLLLLHGWPLSGLTFHRLVPLLQDSFECVVPDLAGAGDSPWDERPAFTIEGRAEVVASLVAELGLERYWLLGQDTGATVARYVVDEHGDAVRGLVMTNTEMPRHRPPWIPFYQKLLALPGTGASFRLLLKSRAFARSRMGFGGCFTDRALLDGTFREHVLERLAASPKALQGQVRILRAIGWRAVDRMSELHARTRCPVLLVWGEDDPTFPIGLARAMVGEFPSAELVAVPGSRLLPHEERPEEVADAIRSFAAAHAG